MPRKKSTIPPATRVRENQRRSRTRRKKLIEDLQQRLRKHEKNELQATILIQMAARKVAWENARLRNLLASKGVSAQEIEEFNSTCGRTDPAPTSSDTVEGGELQRSALVQVHRGQPIEASHIDSPTDQILRGRRGHDSSAEQQDFNGDSSIDESQTTIDTPLDSVNDQVPPPGLLVHDRKFMDSSAPNVPSSAVNNCGWNNSNMSPVFGDQQQSLLPAVSDCFCPIVPTRSLPSRDDSMLKMSCETASSIIAGMRGNGDKDQARLELGCEGDAHCNVKNIKVLQVMEMD